MTKTGRKWIVERQRERGWKKEFHPFQTRKTAFGKALWLAVAREYVVRIRNTATGETQVVP